MIVRLLSAALVAGFLASVVATGLQLALTSPLILQAETFEGGHSHAHAPTVAPASLIVKAHAHGHGEAAEGEAKPDEWQPAEGFQRMAFTGLATLIGGVGYALLLAAVMLALRREPTPRSGLAVGISGFLAVALAPAIGLPPELPGMGAAPLVLRQTWWVMTVAATGIGLYLIAVRRVPITILGGLILIVAPHLAGAPQSIDTVSSQVPPAVAAQFVARSLAIGFVFWALIGLAYGWAWGLFGREAGGRAHA
ncbi:CbtA family protein [Methylorubrum salsuginis]|uniref:Cobalt transporter subunit CbtA n=1 Tax=Methylorubrum salsuginis TaxID=414703 RepID=A0A1I4CBY7_9HYPH|nr:CbtA family protein [Methylorubrum salsuginis]SFK78718.1 cobalt transporter subunit CbtA [Methylorubrum salsuginis]